MSTDHRALNAIPFHNLFDGRLDKYGIREIIKSDTSESLRYLSGKDGILSVYKEQGGADSSFERPSFAPMPWAIFDALATEFGTDFVSEHDHRYWGFDTVEEWNALQDKLARDDDDDFYRNVLRFTRVEPHELTPGTIGLAKAEIARGLIDKDPSLAEQDRRVALFAMITETYERKKPPLRVELTGEDLAKEQRSFQSLIHRFVSSDGNNATLSYSAISTTLFPNFHDHHDDHPDPIIPIHPSV